MLHDGVVARNNKAMDPYVRPWRRPRPHFPCPHGSKWRTVRHPHAGNADRGVDMEDKLVRLMEEVELQIGRITRSENAGLLEIVKLFY